jgi:hypothetical protein
MTSRIMISFEDGGDMEVFAESEHFSGSGSAYIGTDRLREFAMALLEFPLPTDPAPRLAGGLEPRTSTPVTQEHLALEIRPVDSRGQLGIWVRMTDWESDDRAPHDLQEHAHLRVLTTYRSLGRLNRGLLALANGETNRFEYVGEELD